MLSTITRFSIRNPGIILAGAVASTLLFLHAARTLPLDAFPETTPPIVTVNVEAPQRTAQEVERTVTVSLERALLSLPGLAELRTRTREGLAQATLVFEEGVAIADARQRVSERLAAVEGPPGVAPPTLGPRTSPLGEVIHLRVRGEGSSLVELRQRFERELSPRLARIAGVAEVVPWGGAEPELRVTLDPDRAVQHGVSLSTVVEAVAESSSRTSTGTLRAGAGGGAVVAETVVREPADLALTPLPGGAGLVLTDVASVGMTEQARSGAATADGAGEVLIVLVFADTEASPYRVARAVEDEVAAIPRRPGFEVEVVYSRASLVDRVLHTVRRNLLEAAALVAAILLVFLGRLRAGILVALVIPFGMLFALFGLSLLGIPGTLLSLGAMDFGLVVDSSVIIAESVRRRLAESGPTADRDEIVLRATLEVRRPAIAGELVVAAVYLPFLVIGGAAGKLFAPMACTVLLALAGGVLFSMTVVPAWIARVTTSAGESADLWTRRIEPQWRLALRILLRRPLAVTLPALAAVLVGGACLSRMEIAFVPDLREGSVVVNVVRPGSTLLDDAVASATRIERQILESFPGDVSQVYSCTGAPSIATDPMGPEISDVFISLRDGGSHLSNEDLDAWIEHLGDLLGDVPGTVSTISQPIALRTAEAMSGSSGDIVLRISGGEADAIARTAERITEEFGRIDGVGEVRPPLVADLPRIALAPDRAELARLGVSVEAFASVVDAMDGMPVSFADGPQAQIPIAVRIGGVDATHPSVGSLPLLAPNALATPIEDVAALSTRFEPARIDRVDGVRQQTIAVSWERGESRAVVEAVRRILAEPGVVDEGVWVRVTGEWEDIERTGTRLAVVLPGVLLFILLVVRRAYGSWRVAARVLIGIPFAVSGGVWLLVARGMPLSLPAVVGLVTVAGMGVLGDMVLFSRVAGTGSRETDAVAAAAAERTRPVLMTALVTGLGLVPMAFHDGIGAEVVRPLATAVIGGVVTSTLATLIVLPALLVRNRMRAESGGSAGR